MTEEELEQLAKRRVQARMGFVIHAMIYIFANGLFVMIWMLTGRGYPWFLWPLTMWGIGLVGHAISLLVGPDSPGEERAVDRELRRLRMHAR